MAINIIRAWRLKRKSSQLHRVIRVAHERYQLCEYKGELWLTFDGARVMPESMMYKSALETVAELRQRFIEIYSQD